MTKWFYAQLTDIIAPHLPGRPITWGDNEVYGIVGVNILWGKCVCGSVTS